MYEQTFNRPYPAQLQVLQNGDAVYLDLNGDRKIDANDMSYDYGFTDDPEYMVGINFGFSWKIGKSVLNGQVHGMFHV